QTIHLPGDYRIALGCHGRGPVARHKLIGDAAEQKHAAALGVLGGEGIPLGILIVGPAHIARGIDEVAVEGHVVEDDQFPHGYSPVPACASASEARSSESCFG